MKTGDVYQTAKYGWLRVISYYNAKKVVVQFEDTGYQKTTRAEHIRNDLVCDPTTKRVCGVGIYDIYDRRERSRSYNVWYDIIRRCYDPSCKAYHRYGGRGVEVCDEWKIFSEFNKWFELNYIEDYELDKDILDKTNTVYSPETCVFVPKRINSLCLISNKNRGDLPIGVTYHHGDRVKRYQAAMKKNDTKISLGYYLTAEEAFYAYKEEKEKFIKEIAEEYHQLNCICDRVYSALMSWSIDIDD